MGYVRNHAILVTGTYGDYIDRAHAEAKRIFPWVSEIHKAPVNDSRSFFIPPDGSKEGWTDSHEGDAQRCAFKKWLKAIRDERGWSPIDWVEVFYGGDDACPTIVSHSGLRVI